MKEKDIVYFVKESDHNEELRYSLRTVEENFPHRKVWFFGGCPEGISPDMHIHVNQKGSKYSNVRSMIKLAIDNPDVSDTFWLFNDDFFIMSKIGYVIPAVDGSLARKIQLIERKYGMKTSYSTRLRNTIYALRDMDRDRLNYELHIPMEISKDRAEEILSKFGDKTAFRSAYGNYYDLARSIHPDVKIYDPSVPIDPDLHNVYLSTSDKSFERGIVGRAIVSKFKTPSKYELYQDIED